MSAALDPADLAVVVQGPRGPEIDRCLASVRRFLPGARVVLSTWHGSDASNLPIDDVVLSADPGTYRTTTKGGDPGPFINTNRMIVSTLAGLAAADRPFTMKMRTDSYLDHGGILSLVAGAPAVRGEWALFERAIVVPSLFTRDPATNKGACFHPSDIMQAGLTTDLQRLWNVPMADPCDALHFSDEHLAPAWLPFQFRYYAEQWVFLNALRQRYRVRHDDAGDLNLTTVEASNRALAQNFVVAEHWQCGLRIPHLEDVALSLEDSRDVMSHYRWRDLHTAATTTKRYRPWS